MKNALKKADTGLILAILMVAIDAFLARSSLLNCLQGDQVALEAWLVALGCAFAIVALSHKAGELFHGGEVAGFGLSVGAAAALVAVLTVIRAVFGIGVAEVDIYGDAAEADPLSNVPAAAVTFVLMAASVLLAVQTGQKASAKKRAAELSSLRDEIAATAAKIQARKDHPHAFDLASLSAQAEAELAAKIALNRACWEQAKALALAQAMALMETREAYATAAALAPEN